MCFRPLPHTRPLAVSKRHDASGPRTVIFSLRSSESPCIVPLRQMALQPASSIMTRLPGQLQTPALVSHSLGLRASPPSLALCKPQGRTGLELTQDRRGAEECLQSACRLSVQQDTGRFWLITQTLSATRHRSFLADHTDSQCNKTKVVLADHTDSQCNKTKVVSG